MGTRVTITVKSFKPGPKIGFVQDQHGVEYLLHMERHSDIRPIVGQTYLIDFEAKTSTFKGKEQTSRWINAMDLVDVSAPNDTPITAAAVHVPVPPPVKSGAPQTKDLWMARMCATNASVEMAKVYSDLRIANGSAGKLTDAENRRFTEDERRHWYTTILGEIISEQ